MNRIFFFIGAILGGLAVVAGAYGAHAGAKFFSPENVITFGKAVRYQMHHSLALFAVSWAISQWPGQKRILTVAGWSLVAGILLFSFSLYIMVFTGIDIAIITPFGGTAFIIGWFLLAWAAWMGKE